MIQGNIFETEKAEVVQKGLIISKQQKSLLSKQQQTFNRLVKKIESLRLEMERVTRSLNEKLDFYGKHIHPLELQLTELKTEAIKLLYRFFKDKKLLSKKQRENLGYIISSQLDSIFKFEKKEPEEELKEIFKAVEGISYEQALEEDLDIMKDEMESMFEEFGYDMNFGDMHSKMTEEDIVKKMMEMQEQIKQQANEQNQKRTPRKKTKKQLEKEAREKQIEEARSKNISSIYKQLAKIFHPDLEQDEDLKLQKEELMKKLTIAYEKNDLHTLLSLELAWVQKEETNPGKLTDDKLGIYNEVLKEQVYELEQEIGETLNHPRYQPLQRFATFMQEIKNINLRHEMQQMEVMKNHLATDVAKLKGNEKQVLSVVKELILNFEMQRKYDADLPQFFR